MNFPKQEHRFFPWEDAPLLEVSFKMGLWYRDGGDGEGGVQGFRKVYPQPILFGFVLEP